MKKFAIVGLLWCSLIAFPAFAEEPAANNSGAGEQSKAAGGGCMPDGGCCGACAAARAQAASQGEQKVDHGAKTEAQDVGGCPCKRVKQQSM
ncbi:MAG: hypothetical protein N3C12_00630 [Candidatus Binatia bacterium]|nr:hypothetical protein [Candidatus Binatia bacterium]